MDKHKVVNGTIVGILWAYAGWNIYAAGRDLGYLNKRTSKKDKKTNVELVCFGDTIVRLGDAIADEDLTKEELKQIYHNEIRWLNTVIDD